MFDTLPIATNEQMATYPSTITKSPNAPQSVGSYLAWVPLLATISLDAALISLSFRHPLCWIFSGVLFLAIIPLGFYIRGLRRACSDLQPMHLMRKSNYLHLPDEA
ncbi:hypothetical protein PROFUN_05362 [Planoprotostelium fungivorum]|uniref:Uncharacterized protein n=1 Tax=Planoprotostelium fungivorum TaxID=1890364 RepID=A0A2P6NR55_9EUKA|nr:hypothetical protein PROFUN_05362 [Planoprotostelium fungivorum]